MNQLNEIKVSVCVVVYNQEKYLSECLESLVTQQTNFNFEIIVSDDCSTDTSRKIITEYFEKYPYLIRPVFNEHNLGPHENLKSTYQLAQGIYIAHMDGDDYAFPDKLQKQYDILESNIDCQICSHSSELVDCTSQSKGNWLYPQKKYELFDLYAQLPFFAHSSKMFRNDLNEVYWDNLHENFLDIELHIEQALKGKIYHLNEILGAYRVDVGISRIGKSINPILPLGVIRAFDKGLTIYSETAQIDKFRKIYAKELLNYARKFLYTCSDYAVFCLLIKKSIDIKIFSSRQFLLLLLTVLPKSIYSQMKSDKRLDI